ncbi:cytochrome-c oxidase, cbb3-type subunit III [Kaustia mangrovi]|uniref:Cbb3-type cytochrome c oxidase subunit n=1 Tax=Kaustia mangrovi TaxID=2593653 RepID=A0A7S8C3F9_9HYPH|nr:cytochrome-c oxidase, cbb3-type subunit III [Kaustia mangrovi]QPC42648.1 cytochrome-c oxidase, cbb3-type subunit III [Kaustia mangrovi]
MAKPETDEITGTETTGHEWDGIKELNTPLPRWWLWTFYATIIWAIGYTVLYPAWPLVDGATRGVLGWSSRADLTTTLAGVEQEQSQYLTKINELSLGEIAQDPELYQFAVAGGRSAFAVNCVQCHGSGAQGFEGYPNLNDDSWLWGGTLDDIYTTVRHGIRYEADEDTRLSQMPAFGRDGMLDRTQVNDVAEYVLSLSGQDHDAAAAQAGAAVYTDNCAVCHGDKGQGSQELGAPRLNDAIWLYGGDKASIVAQVNAPRHGVMPAWSGRLDPVTIKQLVLFVHSLGGGE